MALKFQYDGETLTIEESAYVEGGAMAVSLMSQDGPYAKLSVNFDEATMARLPKRAFYLKDWSENAPVAFTMLNRHILSYSKPHVIALVGNAGWADSVVINDPSLWDADCPADCEYHA